MSRWEPGWHSSAKDSGKAILMPITEWLSLPVWTQGYGTWHSSATIWRSSANPNKVSTMTRGMGLLGAPANLVESRQPAEGPKRDLESQSRLLSAPPC